MKNSDYFKNLPTNSWQNFFNNELEKEYFKKITKSLKEEESSLIYPKNEDIFNAFIYTDLTKIKCVILGQDPYHNENEAHGLAFSVKDNIKIPRSLHNIFIELQSDLGISKPTSGNLIKWATEGVLLLNTYLTVHKNKPLSHSKIGWEIFTDSVLKLINKQDKPICFILWGKNAQTKASLITNNIHKIIIGAHPSPLSARRGFFGNKYFSRANNFLKENNINEIDWKL